MRSTRPGSSSRRTTAPRYGTATRTIYATEKRSPTAATSVDENRRVREPGRRSRSFREIARNALSLSLSVSLTLWLEVREPAHRFVSLARTYRRDDGIDDRVTRATTSRWERRNGRREKTRKKREASGNRAHSSRTCETARANVGTSVERTRSENGSTERGASDDCARLRRSLGQSPLARRSLA